MNEPFYPARVSDVSSPGSPAGLPAAGPGRVAGWSRRIAALVVDWGLSYLAALALAGRGGLTGNAQILPLAIFAIEVWIGTATLGGGLGQLVLGLRVAPLARGRGTVAGPVDPAHAALRTVLLALVVPAVIYDADRRGLHDRAARTVVVSRR